MSRPVDTVIDFLKAEQARGRTHIALDENAKQCLRELHKQSRNRPATQASNDRAKATSTRTHTTTQTRASTPSPTPQSQPLPEVPTGSKSEKLSALREQARNWQPALSLGSLRDTMVFATGNPDARVVLVGEAPGHEEERQGEPFVGPAGQKLNDILKAMGLSREEVYITNIVKFRPATPRQTTNNRKPTPEEMASCIGFVRQEISIVEPECVIALGGTAAEGLLQLNGPVRAMRESWHRFESIPTRVTYHPSYLLQSGGSNQIKRQLWEDMLAVMDLLKLPTSEKQRNFFLPKH